MEHIQGLWEQTAYRQWIIFGIGLILVIGINYIVKRTLNRHIVSVDNRYRARKASNLLAYLLLAIIGIIVFSDRLGSFGVTLGMASAGIAFALQEVIISLAGWVNIILTNAVSVGQRVRIGDVKGDVIDIGMLSTTIMEMGDWVDGDLYNGRIVSIANSFAFKEKVHNYSAEYPFLWDEIKVPIRTESNYELAREVFTKVLAEVTGDYANASQKEWADLADKYRVEQAQVQPMVTISFDENWITFTLRYIVDYKKRRGTKNAIYSALLKAISEHKSAIMIGTSTLEVTTINS